jgi:ATP-binding cassette subfamily F protein uup
MARTILLSCESISKGYGLRPLFTGLSLGLNEGDHMAIVGPNGSGKSTLLKIFAGIESPDSGTRTARRNLRIGYVAQDPIVNQTLTVEDELCEALRMAGLDPHDQAGRLARALSIGCFREADQPVAGLSGGWRKRLAIIRSLILEPDVLLMDEPTNHLDLDGIVWLESLLKAQAKAFLVVSHDRRFLESIASRMVELNPRYPGGLFEAKGRYSDFLEQREAALQVQADYQASLANRVRREVEWLRRGPKARTTKAKGRVQAAAALIEEAARGKARSASSRVDIDFTSSGRRSKQLLVATGIGKSLGGKPVLTDLDLRLGPGQRLGLLGPNGSGKTTLLRLLAGTLAHDSGTITRAEGLRILSFEQHRDSLDQSSTLARALAPAGDAVIFRDRSIHLVSWAKRFLFRPEQLDLPVSRLSGGEQARLLIARLMRQPADLLILDEPTNDLDIPTLDILEENLVDFPGAVVLVTHDRWLLDRLSTVLLALDGRGGAEWYADLAQWEAAQNHIDSPSQDFTKPSSASTAADNHRTRFSHKHKLSYHEQREWDAIEENVLKAEMMLASCQTSLEDPAVVCNAAALQERLGAMETAREEVERLYQRWAELESKQAGVSSLI